MLCPCPKKPPMLLLVIFLVKLWCEIGVADAFSAMTQPNYFAGFDLGTSGARISIIEKSKNNGTAPKEIHSDALTWTPSQPYDSPRSWTEITQTLLQKFPLPIRKNLRSMCFSGTSASCLLADTFGDDEVVTRPPRMYDFDILKQDAFPSRTTEIIQKYVPDRHTARATTGSLAKLLSWNEESPLQPGEALIHQADYMLLQFLPQNSINVVSDWHNCLKLGYDVRTLTWPQWLQTCLQSSNISLDVLPSQVVCPGQVIGTICPIKAKSLQINPNCVLVGSTTDSNAAFFAAMGSTEPEYGTAVTSLGSTLAIKQLSKNYVEDSHRGVYSHRFPSEEEEAWLIGGASNVGCAILRQQNFSNDELIQLSQKIDPSKDSPLQYYPLTKKGERFPVADSERSPVLQPQPESRMEFLHGILQGISDVERDGFRVLGELGADPPLPTKVWTCGGGARNDMWRMMRERRISDMFGESVEVKRALNTEASYGAAILAASSFDLS